MNKVIRCKVHKSDFNFVSLSGDLYDNQMEDFYIEQIKCWLSDLDEIDVEETQEGDIILWYKDLMVN